MGTFNELLLPEIGRVQFKHGMRWQYEYKIGDTISWAPLARPDWAAFCVKVPGIAGGELKDEPYRFFEIEVKDDIIIGAQEISASEYERLEAEYRAVCERQARPNSS